MISAFIFSSPRSGSTVLRLNLNKIDGVVALPETHVYNFWDHNKTLSDEKKIQAWLNYHTVQAWVQDAHSLGKKLTEVELSTKTLLEITAQHYLAEKDLPSDSILVEKSPPHIFYRTQIQADFPNASIVSLYRDPRDVVASLKGVEWSTHNPVVNSRVWLNGVNSIQDQDFKIQYEELVDNPSHVMSSLAEMLGVSFSTDILRGETTDDVETKVESSRNALKEISSEHRGKYLDRLNAQRRELEIIEHICDKKMKELGYKQEGGKRDLKFIWFLYIGYARMVMAKLTGNR